MQIRFEPPTHLDITVFMHNGCFVLSMALLDLARILLLESTQVFKKAKAAAAYASIAVFMVGWIAGAKSALWVPARPVQYSVKTANKQSTYPLSHLCVQSSPPHPMFSDRYHRSSRNSMAHSQR